MKKRRRPLSAVEDGPAPRRRRRRWVLASGVVVAAALAVAVPWVLRQPYLRVQHVSFVGLRHESVAAVLAASGLAEHPSMLTVNDATLERRLERFAWISSVKLTKKWPNTVVVSVKESVAVAVAFGAHHHLEYVNAQGRDLGRAPLSANLPTLRFSGSSSQSWPFSSSARPAAYVASRLPRAFSAQVSVITESGRGSLSLTLTTPVTFVLGSTHKLEAKFMAIASVIAHSTLVPGDVVDVTVPDELAVTPPSG